MSVVSVINKLQSMNSALVTAPSISNYPKSLNDVDLPVILTTIGPGDWTQQSVGYKRQDRQYVMTLYLSPVSQGILSEYIEVAAALIQAIGVMYMNNLTLDGTVDHIGAPMGGIKTVFVRDTGVTGDIVFAGVLYIGCEFTILVAEKGG